MLVIKVIKEQGLRMSMTNAQLD